MFYVNIKINYIMNITKKQSIKHNNGCASMDTHTRNPFITNNYKGNQYKLSKATDSAKLKKQQSQSSSEISIARNNSSNESNKIIIIYELNKTKDTCMKRSRINILICYVR